MNQPPAVDPLRPRQEPMPPRTLDLAHLERQTMGDAALAGEVLQLFLRQALAMKAQLSGALAEADLRRIAHTLAGSARGIGAWQAAQLASVIEAGPADAELGPLLAALDETEAAIRTYLGLA